MEPQTVFARVRPKEIRIVETYHCAQEISRNPAKGFKDDPTGLIEVAVPYDGHQYFTREAMNDVKNQIDTRSSSADTIANIGFLLFNHDEKLNIHGATSPLNRYGALSLTIPARNREITDLSHLFDDHSSCHATARYAPQLPELHPVHVDIELLDEEHIRMISTLLNQSGSNSARKLENIEKTFSRPTNFSRSLLLCTIVKLHLQRKILRRKIAPKIESVSLKWPTITSLHSLRLFAGYNLKPSEVDFNPEDRTLEWKGANIEQINSGKAGEILEFASEPIFLSIVQPGEIYQQTSLAGTIELSIPGVLLSGLQARAFDSLGAPWTGHEPELETRIKIDLELYPEDQFVRRTMSHSQNIYFDEVIPDEMRIADIKNVLTDRGYEISDIESATSPDSIKHLLHASRQEGSDKMELLVFIKGRQHITRRQTELSSRQTYTSDVESGEMQVFMRGELPGSSYAIVREMNAIQLTLRDRFDRLKAKR